MRTGRTQFLAGASAGIMAMGVSLSAQPSSAQNAEQSQGGTQSQPIEEIVVTATKRGDLALQDVPFSVQSLDGGLLDARGSLDFNDFFRLVPGLSVFDQGPGEKRIIMRGINATGAGVVGLYLDEIIITGENAQDGGGRQPDVKLFDIDRVEVLKGPQGTTFGSSSMAGTIRYITNKPVLDEMSARVRTAYTQTKNADPGWKAEGMVNLPLAEDLMALRVSGLIERQKGFIDSIVQDGANDQDTNALRGILRITPTPDFSINLTAMYQDVETDGPAYFNRVDFFGNPISQGESEAFQADVVKTPFQDEIQAYNLTTEWGLSHGTLTGTASFFDRETVFNRDASFALNAFLGLPILGEGRSVITQPKDRELQTYEMRYASDWEFPVQVLLGGFYQAEERFFRSAIFSADDQGRVEDDPTVFLDRNVDTNIDELAFFGEVSYDISDQVTLTGGFRYFDFDIDEQAANTVGFGGGPGGGLGPELDAGESGVIFKGNLAFRPTDRNQIYFRAAEGFRSGGTNDTTAAEIADVVIPGQFESDDLINYELGSKNEFMDGRASLNLATFFIRWDDIQIQNQATDGELEFPFRDNGGEAGIWGLEVEGQISPVAGLDLGANLAWTDAELSEDNPIPSSGRDGDDIPYVPSLTVSLLADYSWEIAAWGAQASVGADIAYVDERNSEFRPDNPLFIEFDDYVLANLRSSLSWGSGWQAQFLIKNLGNDDTVVDVFRINPGLTPDGFIRNWPRTFEFGITKSF